MPLPSPQRELGPDLTCPPARRSGPQGGCDDYGEAEAVFIRSPGKDRQFESRFFFSETTFNEATLNDMHRMRRRYRSSYFTYRATPCHARDRFYLRGMRREDCKERGHYARFRNELGQTYCQSKRPLVRVQSSIKCPVCIPKTSSAAIRGTQNGATERTMPPIALTATTTRGGACQTDRSTNPTSARPKSIEVLTELVHTGS